MPTSTAAVQQQAPRQQARWLETLPARITGLYRCSIMSKEPFAVDIGGKSLTHVRSLEVFHERPMFMDELTGLGHVQVQQSATGARTVRLVPTDNGELMFRLTAEEPVPELDAFAARTVVGKLKTPVRDRGAVGHVRRWSNAKLSDLSQRLTRPDSVGDHVAHAIMLPFVALTAVAPTLPRALAATGLSGAVWAAAMWASTHALQTGIVAAPFAVDPARTYINGRLYKNLAALRITIRRGRILGFTTP